MRPLLGLNFGGIPENKPHVMVVGMRGYDLHRGFKCWKLGFLWSAHPEPVPEAVTIYRKSFVLCFYFKVWREI